MATKSFLKEVVIRDPRLARSFVDALSRSEEKARSKRQQRDETEISRPCTELTGEEIRDFFGVK